MKWVIGGCLVFAFLLAIGLTFIDGDTCEGVSGDHQRCQKDELGWPLAWKTHPASSVDAESEVSYSAFAVDAAVLFLIIGGASLLSVWYFWTRPWERTAPGSRSTRAAPEH